MKMRGGGMKMRDAMAGCSKAEMGHCNARHEAFGFRDYRDIRNGARLCRQRAFEVLV